MKRRTYDVALSSAEWRRITSGIKLKGIVGYEVRFWSLPRKLSVNKTAVIGVSGTETED